MEEKIITEYIPPRRHGGQWSLTATPRRFRLMRREDETGVSGTGHVADGVRFVDGAVALRWRTDTTSTAFYDSIAAVEKIHGHGGKTEVLWLDSGHQQTQFCVCCAADMEFCGWCPFCGAGGSTVTLPPWAVDSIGQYAPQWGRSRPDEEGKALDEELKMLRRKAGPPPCRRAYRHPDQEGAWYVEQPLPSGNYRQIVVEAASHDEALVKSADRLPWFQEGEG